jgi:hypothetical protein
MRRCRHLDGSVPDTFSAPPTGVGSRIEWSSGLEQITWAFDYLVVMQQFVLDTLPYDLNDGTAFAPDEDWKFLRCLLGPCFAQFGINDEDIFADFDIYILGWLVDWPMRCFT